MDKKNYSLSREDRGNEIVYFEYDKINGYKVTPKAKKKDSIEVNKIIFVNDSLSEKIIRKKIDKKINQLLLELKLIEEGASDEGGIKRSLMDAEKLKVQIINNYIKYLGHTYQSLTLKKIQIIINQLRYKLYTMNDPRKFENEYNQYESRRGR